MILNWRAVNRRGELPIGAAPRGLVAGQFEFWIPTLNGLQDRRPSTRAGSEKADFG
jgi:hypothetical protein